MRFPTETHQKLGFDFFAFFPDCIMVHHHQTTTWENMFGTFSEHLKQIKKNDDLTSEYLTGHVPKKHLPPFQRLRDCWLLFLSVIERVTMTSIFVYTLQGTNISPKNGILMMIFLFPRWDMLIPWRVLLS